ncbi:TauD/TfdA family dioxygenase [Gordonia neofelifaecis]|uniref:Taurine catabolism dioxygenase TauD/TfdA n=1 Tax=Gordonia neofelifaecis NRRL B-59395 TaxID=644548 RepID=F1YE11_9ACTN|nr:TauD/TfdA family dioxygenase [Gordonia neofelifaecis]EGD57101.1 Taurine catabolism dioxygenase TauD/TfdA [Gordonia neofelifaecis NRRL B-59395]
MTDLAHLTPVGGRTAWLGSTFNYRDDGLWQLSADELADIDRALTALKSRGDLDLVDITPEVFPLRTIGGLITRLREELWAGRGFVLIRGLDRDAYSDDDLARIYCGLGVHLGEIIPQSGNGEILGHVMNVADRVGGPVRGYRTAQSMNMHSDGHDVVSLLCLREAKTGGASRIASAAAVHDRMLEMDPELTRVLYQGMPIMRSAHDAERGDGRIVTAGDVALFAKPDGKFASCVHVAQTRDAARAGYFDVTPQQEAALDLFCELSASPEFYLDMNIAPGDIQFLNNRLIVHGRTPYEDHEEIERRRHLLRLWVNVPTWPRRAPNQQDIYSMDDLPHWAQHRRPFMEMPTRYLAGIG